MLWSPCSGSLCPWSPVQGGVEVKPIWELSLLWIWEHVQLCADSSCFLPGPSAQPELLHSPHLRPLHHSHHAGLYVGGALHQPRGGDGLEGAGNTLGLALEVAPLPEIPFCLGWSYCWPGPSVLGTASFGRALKWVVSWHRSCWAGRQV